MYIVHWQHSPTRYYRSHSNVKKQESVGITLNKSSCWHLLCVFHSARKQAKQSTLNTYSKLHKGKVKVKFVSKSCWEPSNNTKGITILSLLHARIHSNNFYIIKEHHNVSAMLHLQMELCNNRGNLWGLNDFPSPLLSCNFFLLDFPIWTCHKWRVIYSCFRVVTSGCTFGSV